MLAGRLRQSLESKVTSTSNQLFPLQSRGASAEIAEQWIGAKGLTTLALVKQLERRGKAIANCLAGFTRPNQLTVLLTAPGQKNGKSRRGLDVQMLEDDGIPRHQMATALNMGSKRQ
jgi:hypothetical protein